jgi:hypothetical protein
MIIGKNTPTSAFSALLNFCNRLKKIDADSCSAAGILLALFLSRDRHRYCLIAAQQYESGGGAKRKVRNICVRSLNNVQTSNWHQQQPQLCAIYEG